MMLLSLDEARRKISALTLIYATKITTTGFYAIFDVILLEDIFHI
ncbi:hypothetical protein VIS19158_15229 [Vibrio scophthalmi LMG 19158]|uniref:Uncharacterized protein n=1 Tax=Vibrio scophthalmi LMG 19158 TaxID=870967 RepID=F9RUQ8_9VIBR|nr:hypothetical protein VIS19158_15229 [Vibrio scophthalmi LMG 19158]